MNQTPSGKPGAVQSEFSFGGLTVIGNTFTASDAASFTTFLTIKPFGSGHFVNGLTVEGNVFKAISGNIDRVEVVDSSIAPLDQSRTRRVLFQGNAYNGIDNPVSNPATEDFTVASPQATWTLGFDSLFPFDGIARRTQSVVVEGSLTNGVGAEHWGVPHATTGTGAGQDEVQLTWSEPVQGKVTVTARIDNPN